MVLHKRKNNNAFDQHGNVSCGSEAGSAFSQDTITDSMLELRARVAEKRTRALRRLRGMMNIAKVWKLSIRRPVVKKFQKTVRRLIYGLRLQKHFVAQRRYPNISNPRARKAIYRLMMLVRMKLRNTAAAGWKEKWTRARRRVRGMLYIMAVVKSERIERIENMYADEGSCQDTDYDEVKDEVSELGKIDDNPHGNDPLSALR